ncbi:MAG: MFS transporter [Paracoccaceae bacterium]|nr:MFS transporter [Paracoccaceae bacterium]
MSILKAAVLARSSNAGLATVGVFWGGFSALVPDLKAGISAPDDAFGLSMMMAAFGGIAAMAIAPRLMSFLGRSGMLICGLLLVPAFFLLLLPQSAAGFGAIMILIGAAVSFLDIAANMRISVLEERHSRHLMNFSHAMFSFGFAGSALITSLGRKAGFGPQEILPMLAVVALGLCALMWEAKDWRGPVPEPAGSDQRKPWAVIVLTAAILLAAFVSENAGETWTALHIERTLGGPAGEGGFGPVALGLTMGVGRLMGQAVAARIGATRLVMWSACLGVAGAMIIALAPTPFVAVAGVGLLGLGVAVTVPSANSILGGLVRPDQRAHAISRAWMIGFTGFFIGPTAVGIIAEMAGLRIAFAVIAIVMAMIIPLALTLKRRGG